MKYQPGQTEHASGSDALALIKRIKRLPPVASLLALRLMVAEERNTRSATPLGRKLMLWRSGFTSALGTLYGLPRPDMEEYVSTFTFHVARNRINGNPELFTDKLVLRTFLLSMGFHQAETLAVSVGGRILLDPFGPAARTVSPAELEAEVLSRGGDFIIKPSAGYKGIGVYRITAAPNGIARRRGADYEPWSAAGLPRRGTIIFERWVDPAPFWRELFPDSGNTIRLLTLWTPGEPAPFLARAVQRIGTRAIAPTDNFSTGGIAATVDIESGVLGAGSRLRSGPTPEVIRLAVHPDSGAVIEGTALPFWNEIKTLVLQAATRFPMNPWIGWDVLVDRTGTPIVIEANTGGVRALQLDSGLLHDPRVRDFFEKTGILRRRRAAH